MRLLVALFLFGLLAACSSGVKDYSNATKLTDIETRAQVKPLWINHTAFLPRSSHTQLAPVVEGGNLYFADVKGVVSAVNAQDGSSHWRTSLGERLSGGPGVGFGLVVVGTRKAEIVALNQDNGKEIWRSRVSTEMLAHPQIEKNHVILQTSDGKISALDVNTGKLLWNYSREIPSLTLRGTSTPLVVGNRVLSGFADGKLVSLNLNTGELQWETTIAVSRGRTDLERLVDIDGLFSVKDDIVYVSSYQGKIAAISIANGNVIWSREISSYTGLTLDDRHIFISDSESHVWGLDQRTGESLWRQDNLVGRDITVPVVVGKAVVVADYDGYIHWLSMEDGGFIARQNLEKIWLKANLFYPNEPDTSRGHRTVTAPPVVTGDKLFVRDNLGALAALQLQGMNSAQ